MLNAVGRDGQGNHLALHGSVRDLRPPNPNFPPSPCLIAALRYKLTGPGTQDEGLLLLLRDMPDGGINPGPPNIVGRWTGHFDSSGTPGGGDIKFNLTPAGNDQDPNGQKRPTAFEGTASFFYPPDPGAPNGSFFDFAVRGTVGPREVHADQSFSAPFAAIAMCPPGPRMPPKG